MSSDARSPVWHRHREQSPVATAEPGLRIRRTEQGFDFVPVEPGHGRAEMAFARHGQNALCEGRVLRLVQGDMAEEGADRGQAGVAGARLVAALVLDMAEEVAEEGGVEVFERQFRRRLLQLPLGVAHQQSEGVPVAGDGVRACLALLHEVVAEEPGQEPREVGGTLHGRGLGAMRSSRRAAACISSGVAERYQ